MLTAILSSCKGRIAQSLEPTNTSAARQGAAPIATTTLGEVSTSAAAECPAPSAADLDLFAKSTITAADSGRTIVVHETTRFSLYLDDRTYTALQLSTSPDGILGKISNGSIRGPRCFPAMFEALKEGTALIRDRDFQLRVDVDNQAPESSMPLH